MAALAGCSSLCLALRCAFLPENGKTEAMSSVEVTGFGALPSGYDVTGLATNALVRVAQSVADLVFVTSGTRPKASVDRRLASLWMGTSYDPIGWTPAPVWDPIAGDYRTSDGWIRLHTNAAPHKVAALKALGILGDGEVSRDEVAKIVLGWSGYELQEAVVAAGGVAAKMQTRSEWESSKQGLEANGWDLVSTMPAVGETRWRADCKGTPARPLEGVRVLDLTKVLAGPVATRILASLGAQVTRVDSPTWEEPGVSIETTMGKQCIRIDGKTADGQAQLHKLFHDADMFLNGYRPGALKSLNLPLNHKLEVTLQAFTGRPTPPPWAERRGFDSIVQMACGIAEQGMHTFDRDKPTPLPVQALDHVTGYLMAAGAIEAWTRQLKGDFSLRVYSSLQRTAHELMNGPVGDPNASIAPPTDADYESEIEHTSWGPVRRLRSPFAVGGVDIRWDRGAVELGSDN
jgi:CoA-transferase family III